MNLPPAWPTFYDILTAYKSCRLSKPASHSQIRFEYHLSDSITSLHNLIHSSKYKPLPSKCFVVTHPKPREIFAANFRDRVVHHLVVKRLDPIWDKKFIYSSFACRKDKGSHGAIQYLQKKLRILSQGGITPVWCLQLDLEKFFVSINRDILCKILLKDIKHTKLRELVQIIYSHDARVGATISGRPEMLGLIPKGKSWFEQNGIQGLPIGNLTSQFGANVYLTALDHYIQRSLKPHSYLRYMDDLLLLDHNPNKLQSMIEPIDHWIKCNRSQRLNPSKTILTQLSNGILYLGYELYQTECPKQPLQIFSEPLKKWKFIQSLKMLEKTSSTTLTAKPNRPHPLSPVLPNKTLCKQFASVNSRIGSLVHANTFFFRKKALQKFICNTNEFKKIPPDLAFPWSPFKLKKGYRSVLIR